MNGRKPAKAKGKTKAVRFGKGKIRVPDDDAPPLVDVDEQQPPLVPLSEKELKDAGKKLAGLVRDLEDLTTSHQGLRAEMKAERTAVREEMAAVAQTIRQQGR